MMAPMGMLQFLTHPRRGSGEAISFFEILAEATTNVNRKGIRDSCFREVSSIGRLSDYPTEPWLKEPDVNGKDGRIPVRQVGLDSPT